MFQSWRPWMWLLILVGGVVISGIGCDADSGSRVEMPEEPTEAPAAPPSSSLPPPPPPQY